MKLKIIMKWGVVGAAILAYPTTGAAESACLKVESELDRLACYDKEAGRIPIQKSEAPQGKWTVSSQTSKMTDDVDVVIGTESEEVINCGWNKGGKITLVIRCMEKRTSLYFDTGCHMASSDYDSYGEIQYRLDTEKTRTISGDASTNNRALGLWSGGKSIPIIKQMFGKSEMVVRMTPYSENPFTATFDVANLDEAVKPLRKSCGW